MAHSIGKTIAELRKAKGWTQRELAGKLQVSDKTISKWEKDVGSPSIEFFPILAKIFNVSVDYLMIGDKAESNDDSCNSDNIYFNAMSYANQKHNSDAILFATNNKTRKFKTPKIVVPIVFIVLSIFILCYFLIPKHNHNYTEIIIEPTCEEMGFTKYTCTCGDTYDDSYIEPLGHKYDSLWYCSECETQLLATMDLFFAPIKNNTEYAVGIGESSEKNVVIPSVYNGKNVTEIAEKGFEKSDIISIKIPDNVTKLGEKSFYQCGNLQEVIMGNGIKTICENAFGYCSKLENIILSKNLKTIETYGFGHCYSLKSIILPEGVEMLEAYAFFGCSTLSSIELPYSLRDIGISAFYDCHSLPFNEYCSALYLGNKENKYFALIKTKTTQVIDVEINDECKIISAYAFSDCNYLTSIILPTNIKNVDPNAFTSSIFGSNNNCNNLQKVYFCGTEEEWIQLGIHNSKFTQQTLFYYSETKPNKFGNYWYYDNKEITIWTNS